jgi:hypothetical protein
VTALLLQDQLKRKLMHEKKDLIVTILCIGILLIAHSFLGQLTVAFDAFAWAIIIILAAVFLRVATFWKAHQNLLLVVLSLLVFGVGLSAFVAVLLWMVSSWSLGVFVLERLYRTKDLELISITESTVLGSAIWLSVWGAMLHFYVNYQAIHIALCLLSILLISSRITEIQQYLFFRIKLSSGWIETIPFWLWCVGLVVVSWVLRWSSFPSMGYDDHANHLRMWTELLTTHRYSFDITSQIWTASPFSVNLLHAGLSLMAGSDARSAMNLGLAILLLSLVAAVLRTWKLSASIQWLLVVLMASTPMLGNLLLHLQTELLLAVIALAGMLLVIEAKGGWRGQRVIGVLSCAALCASIKLPGAVLGITLLAALTVCWWSEREATMLTCQMLRWPALILLIPLSFLAFHAYAQAWMLTGNPFFPLYNAVFRSPFYDPINFSDSRWIHGFSFTSYLRLFFNTSEFFESGNYIAGWQNLIMLPMAMIVFLFLGTPSRHGLILIPIFGFGLVMFSATQYLRYLFPVMPLGVVFLGILFVQEKSVLRKIASLLAIGCITANLIFFTRVSWMMNSPASIAFNRDGKETLISLYAPVGLLTDRVNQLAPGSRVLYPPSTPYGATLHGSPLYLNWYQPFRDKAFGLLNDDDDLRDFLLKEKVDFAILMMSAASNSRDVFLREYMSQYGYVEGQADNALLYRISNIPVQYQAVFTLRETEAIPSKRMDFLFPMTGQDVVATEDGKVLAVIPTHRARQARYTAEFSCPSNVGYFVAQINWDKGAPYYRLVACDTKIATFVEAIPIPVGSSQGSIFVTSRETSSIQVKNISVEVN